MDCSPLDPMHKPRIRNRNHRRRIRQRSHAHMLAHRVWPAGKEVFRRPPMHIDPFQATLLSLAGMLAFGFLASSIFQTIVNTMPRSPAVDDDEYEDDDEDEEEFDVEDADEEPVVYANIPLWRQSLKTPDFSNTRPDDRCPCGSGRKYKNCHGAKHPRT